MTGHVALTSQAMYMDDLVYKYGEREVPFLFVVISLSLRRTPFGDTIVSLSFPFFLYTEYNLYNKLSASKVQGGSTVVPAPGASGAV